ncbi:serine protein kinase RIO [Candidatus Woesearchaeota archaeon]|nr:serine protein kinase RIO [Candidatus Woesearchaeota archaeon]
MNSMLTVPKTQKEEWKTYKNVFDQHSLLILEKFRSQGHYDELKSPLALGKEANIFSAMKGEDEVIIKIYRLENCNFNKMYQYIAPDARFFGVKKRRRLVIFAWVQREYRNLLKAREVIKVPTPMAVRDNVLIMEFIGRHGEPAPQLKDSPPKDPKKFYRKVKDNIRALYRAELVHADLSEFNILNFEEEPVFIDFSQGTTTAHPHAEEFLRRDVKNIVRYFGKQGLKLDEEREYEDIVK